MVVRNIREPRNMKKILILIFTFSPLISTGQQLECCKTTKDVGIYLNGNWEFKNDNLKQQLRFEFTDEIGKFWKYKFNDIGDLVEVEEIKQVLEIFETTSGYEIDWSDGYRLGTSKIKILNSTNLVFERRDGKESEYFKIEDR